MLGRKLDFKVFTHAPLIRLARLSQRSIIPDWYISKVSEEISRPLQNRFDLRYSLHHLEKVSQLGTPADSFGFARACRTWLRLCIGNSFES